MTANRAKSVTLSHSAGPEFARAYDRALYAYLLRPGEAELGQAYEMGRAGLDAGRSIPELVALWTEALLSYLGAAKAPLALTPTLRAGVAFLAESLSPFELSHRGHLDSIAALRRVNEALEKEIARIAHSLHDQSGQLLVTVHLALSELGRDLPAGLQPRLAQVGALLDKVELQLRNLSHELRPTVLEDLGWLPAIEFLARGIARRAGLAIDVTSTVDGRLPVPRELALYRTVQEALTNTVRHAQAETVRISVSREGDWLQCDVVDDGVGMSAGGGHEGLGLRAMRERLDAVDGSLEIDSAPGRGTRIRIRVPAEP